jgi:hypothetical protein
VAAVAVVVVPVPAGLAAEETDPDREVEQEAEEGEERDQEEERAHVTPQAVGPGGSYLMARKTVKPSNCIILDGRFELLEIRSWETSELARDSARWRLRAAEGTA